MRYKLLLTIMCVMGIAGVGVVYLGYYAQFIKMQTLRTAPLGEPLARSTMLPDNPHVIMLGDSRLAMWPDLKGGAFASMPNTPLSLPVENRALGGTTSSQTLLLTHRLPWSSTVKHTVLIESGINDLHWLGGASTDQQKQVLRQLKTNLSAMTAFLASHGQNVVLMTVWPPGKVPLIRTPFWAAQTLDWIDEINQHIHGLASPQIQVWDPAALLSTPHRQLKNAFVDADFFLHINPQGYQTLRRNITLR